MPSDPPVDFQQLAQGPTGTTNADYPYSIKATDLMKNFVFATLDGGDGIFEEATGLQGYRQRRLRLLPGAAAGDLAYWNGENWAPLSPPSGAGVHVLASSGGTPYWLETEACD